MFVNSWNNEIRYINYINFNYLSFDKILFLLDGRPWDGIS